MTLEHTVLDIFDYVFPENGLMAYHEGKLFHSQVSHPFFPSVASHACLLHNTVHERFPWRGKVEEIHQFRAQVSGRCGLPCEEVSRLLQRPIRLVPNETAEEPSLSSALAC